MNTIPLTILTLLPAAPLAEDWPQLHGPTGDRRAAGSVEASSLAEPEVVWRIPTALGFSSFSIADERAFTLVVRADEDGTQRETCIALDLDDGAEIWARPLGAAEYDGGGGAGTQDNRGGDGPRVTPVVADGRVYVYDAHLVLTCLDAKDGAVRWQRDVRADHEGRQIKWQNASAPVVEGGRVLVAGGGAGQSLLAFDAKSGALRWKTGDETLTHATPTVATIGGVRQVIFFMRSGLIAVAPKTGDELWRIEYPFSVSSAASPVVWEDIVYVSAGYGVGAGAWRIERKGSEFTPEFLWRERRLPNHWSTPVCKDGYLYGMFSFKKYGEGPLMCVELATGEEQWSTPGFGQGNLILADDQLIALSDAGEVVVIEATPDAYRERGRADVLDGKCWSSPALVDGQLFVRSTSEGIRLDLSGSGR